MKIKYADVHEPELVTGNGFQVYSKVKILEFMNITLNKVKIYIISENLQGL